MERERVILDGWPALMSAELASRYLSIDEAYFRSIITDFRVSPVLFGTDTPRWRKVDLDRLVRRLPAKPSTQPPARLAYAQELSDAAIEKLAAALSMRLEIHKAATTPALVSIKDAMHILGLGRTMVYRLIREGKLEVRRIGSRTLVPRASMDAILTPK